MSFPMKLKIRSGLRWRGSLTVIERRGDDGYLVQFDAEVVGASAGSARHVYDRALLSAAQLVDWTGYALPIDGEEG